MGKSIFCTMQWSYESFLNERYAAVTRTSITQISLRLRMRAGKKREKSICQYASEYECRWRIVILCNLFVNFIRTQFLFKFNNLLVVFVKKKKSRS